MFSAPRCARGGPEREGYTSRRPVLTGTAYVEPKFECQPQHRSIGGEHVTDHGSQATIAGYTDEFRQQAFTQPPSLPCIQHGYCEFAVIATGTYRVTTFTQLARLTPS